MEEEPDPLAEIGSLRFASYGYGDTLVVDDFDDEYRLPVERGEPDALGDAPTVNATDPLPLNHGSAYGDALGEFEVPALDGGEQRADADPRTPDQWERLQADCGYTITRGGGGGGGGGKAKPLPPYKPGVIVTGDEPPMTSGLPYHVRGLSPGETEYWKRRPASEASDLLRDRAERFARGEGFDELDEVEPSRGGGQHFVYLSEYHCAILRQHRGAAGRVLAAAARSADPKLVKGYDDDARLRAEARRAVI